jgi:hypothetical protein
MSKETPAETSRALDTSARHAPEQTEEICCPIIELRQYIHHPGRRDEFIALFDEYFIEEQELSTPAYFCARIILTAHFSYSFQQLTISKVLSCLFCSSRRSMQPPHPTAGRLHLDPLWWTAGAETSEREIDRRASSSALVSTAKPTTGIQVVRPAAPHCLDSLTPDARRAGPLHPRPHRFASWPSKASLAPG